MRTGTSEPDRLRCWIGGAPPAHERDGGPAPETARAWAERGERELLSGANAAAGASFERAIALDPAYPWVYAHRAALHFREGSPTQAAVDAGRLGRLKGGEAAACVIKSVLAEEAGRADEALDWLDRALKCRPAGWLYALRAALHARQGRTAESLHDFGRDRGGFGAPWLVLQKADILRRQGLWARAFRHLEQNQESLRRSPELLRRAASLCLDQGEYGNAALWLGRALALSPGDADLLTERAKVRFIEGRGGAAAGDLDRACGLRPRDPQLNLRRRHLQVLLGAFDRSMPAVWGPLAAGGRDFLLGCIGMRRRNYARSQSHFESALAACGPEDRWITERAGFYRLVAKVLAAAEPAPRARAPEMVLLGLGMRQPYQVTSGSLRWLAACDVIYNYIPDLTVLELLGLFPLVRRTIICGPDDNPARVTTKLAFGALRGARRVAFVTRGNALMYGRVPRELLRQCLRRGIPCRATGSISMFEWVSALAQGTTHAAPPGLQIRNFYSIDQTFDPKLPLIVYFPAEREDPGKVARVLRRAYPAAHPCHIFTGAGGNELSEAVVPMRRLERVLSAGDPGATLFLPPRV
jgi:tetratricopeptide (TPR) repeat protein